MPGPAPGPGAGCPGAAGSEPGLRPMAAAASAGTASLPRFSPRLSGPTSLRGAGTHPYLPEGRCRGGPVGRWRRPLPRLRGAGGPRRVVQAGEGVAAGGSGGGPRGRAAGRGSGGSGFAPPQPFSLQPQHRWRLLEAGRVPGDHRGGHGCLAGAAVPAWRAKERAPPLGGAEEPRPPFPPRLGRARRSLRGVRGHPIGAASAGKQRKALLLKKTY